MFASKRNILIVAGVFILLIIIILAFVLNAKNTVKQEKEIVGETSDADTVFSENLPALVSDSNKILIDLEKELNIIQQGKAEMSKKEFANEAGRYISLDDFLSAVKIKAEAGVQQSSSQKDYSTFFCKKNGAVRPSVGIMLQLRRDVGSEQYQNLYTDMEKYMKNWEKSIFQDLAPLFFPNESFDGEPSFSVSKYTTSNKANAIQVNYANLAAVSKKEYSIDWGFLNDNVFISNDKDCLRKMLDANADAYEL